MNLMQLNLRTAEAHGLAEVKIKITGQVDEDGCVKVTCVETVTSDTGQTVILSDETGE